MEQRQYVEVNGVWSDVRGDAEVDRIPEVHPMGDHRPLGMAGGAGGVHDRDQIIVGQGLAPAVLAVEAGEGVFVGVRLAGRIDGQNGADPAPAPQRPGRLAERRVVDQQHRFAVVQNVFELRNRQTPIQQHTDRPGPGAGELQVEEFDAVVGQDRDPVAAPDPERP